MDELEAKKVLMEVKSTIGRFYKSKIRIAWMYGTYNLSGLGKWSSQLQQIRNQFGPSWLVNLKLGG